MKRLSILFIAFVLVFNIAAQVQVEKTVPQKVELSDIREFVVNVSSRTIDIHLENGKSYTLDRTPFLVFWDSMTTTQKNVVREFIKQCAALAASIDISKITGDFGE